MSTGKKLHAFGDSFTYGHGLPDCLTGLDGPSKLAYPHKLAQKLDCEYVVHAKPGSSPRAQYNRFIFEFDKINSGDVVTFLWPFSARNLIYLETDFNDIDDTAEFNLPEVQIMVPGEDDEFIEPNPGFPISMLEYFAGHTNTFNDIITLSTFIKSVDVMCKQKDIFCIQRILDPSDYHWLTKLKSLDICMNALRQINYGSRSFHELGTNLKKRNRINKLCSLNCDFVEDGHLNEDMHIVWSALFHKSLISLQKKVQ